MTGLVTAPFVMGVSVQAGADPVQPSLARVAATRGRYFGAAARIDQIEADRDLGQAMLRDCSYLTPEIHTNWDYLEPERGHWTFAPADALVALARENGLRVRGHSLLWDQSTPGWAKAEMLETRDWRVVARHFGAVLPRYREGIHEWDVVNEAIDTVGGRDGLRTNTFLRAYGPDYIRRALEEARAFAPETRLVLNEYGLDYDNVEENDRRYRFLKLIEQLKTAGAPLDAIGLQAHLDLSKGPLKAKVLAPFLREIADFGLDIAITELDVKEHDYGAPIAARDARAAKEARAYLNIVLDQPAVKGVTTWGLSDLHSWLDGAQPGPAREPGPGLNRGLPYDDALARKPMYWALRDALASAA